MSEHHRAVKTGDAAPPGTQPTDVGLNSHKEVSRAHNVYFVYFANVVGGQFHDQSLTTEMLRNSPKQETDRDKCATSLNKEKI